MIDLYGILDPVTRDWTDGLLSNIFRDINKPTDKNERKYIVYDGDVDALWVENMNSVMDDNKLLTLANGERIRLQKHCAMLFEVIIIYLLNIFLLNSKELTLCCLTIFFLILSRNKPLKCNLSLYRCLICNMHHLPLYPGVVWYTLTPRTWDMTPSGISMSTPGRTNRREMTSTDCMTNTSIL